MSLDGLNKKGECPDCGNSTFLHGPCGGMAENIRCFECGSEFNFSPPFDPERIARDAPEIYHTSFNLRQELIEAKIIDDRPWWKRMLRLT